MDKQQLHSLCIQHIDKRIADIQTDIDATQESMRSETKSSAGDKYETSREMMQQEMDKQQAAMLELMKQRDVLLRIADNKAQHSIQLGSLAVTNSGNFYIAAAIGKVSIGADTAFVISPDSPLGNKLLGLSKGDKLQFNGKDYEIKFIL